MNKFMNNAENFVPEMLEGLALSNPDMLTWKTDGWF